MYDPASISRCAVSVPTAMTVGWPGFASLTSLFHIWQVLAHASEVSCYVLLSNIPLGHQYGFTRQPLAMLSHPHLCHSSLGSPELVETSAWFGSVPKLIARTRSIPYCPNSRERLSYLACEAYASMEGESVRKHLRGLVFAFDPQPIYAVTLWWSRLDSCQ